MALLAAVAAQAATALENGRLYRQLRMKADELERMREFSENILESLNDGLAVVNRETPRGALEPPPRRAVRRAARGRGRPPAERALRSARSSRCSARDRESRRRHRVLPRAAVDAARAVAAAAGERRDDAAARLRRGDRRHHPDHRGHLQPRAARRAAADLREDGVDRPARRRRGARGQHAADRHLELHADAAAERRARRPAHQGAGEDRAADVPRRQDRQRPAQPGPAGAGRFGPDRSARRDQRRALAARAPAQEQQHPGAQGAAAAGRRSCRASSTSCSRCS